MQARPTRTSGHIVASTFERRWEDIFDRIRNSLSGSLNVMLTWSVDRSRAALPSQILSAPAADGTDDFGKGGFATVGGDLIDPLAFFERYYVDSNPLNKDKEYLDIPSGYKRIVWNDIDLGHDPRFSWAWDRLQKAKEHICWSTWALNNVSWKVACPIVPYTFITHAVFPFKIAFDGTGNLWSFFYFENGSKGTLTVLKGRPYDTGDSYWDLIKGTAKVISNNSLVKTTCGLIGSKDPRIGTACLIVNAVASGADVPPVAVDSPTQAPVYMMAVSRLTPAPSPSAWPGVQFPVGTIARWNAPTSEWWIFYPGNPGGIFGVHLGGVLAAASDPLPDAKVAGAADMPPAGTMKGKPMVTPLYKRAWFWVVAAVSVAAVGGATLLVVRRRRRLRTEPARLA